MSFCFPDASMCSVLSNMAGGKQVELSVFINTHPRVDLLILERKEGWERERNID